MIKKLLGIVVLTISFSFGHTAFAVDCFSNCVPRNNHCCYFEWGYCPESCGYFYFRKCFLDSCNYT